MIIKRTLKFNFVLLISILVTTFANADTPDSVLPTILYYPNDGIANDIYEFAAPTCNGAAQNYFKWLEDQNYASDAYVDDLVLCDSNGVWMYTHHAANGGKVTTHTKQNTPMVLCPEGYNTITINGESTCEKKTVASR